MKKNFELTDDGKLIIKVDWAHDDYVKYVSRAQEILASEVQVRGFRKGKAPLGEAIRYLKAEDVYNKMINLLVKNTNKTLLEGAPKDYGISLVEQPDIKVSYDEKADTYSLTYTCISIPMVTLGETKNLVLTSKKKTVSAADVNEELNKIRDGQAILESKEGDYKAVLGDVLSIDAIGYVDNHSFEGGNLKDYELELGSHTFVGDFEDQLVGVVVGEERGVDIVFPENYIAELANKKAHFDVKVLQIKTKVYPNIDDELAKESDYGVETLVELKKAIKKKLEDSAELSYKNALYEEVLDKIEKGSKIVLNPKIVEYEINARFNRSLEEAKKICGNIGITLEEYYKLTNQSEEKMRSDASKTAESDVKRVAVFEKLCDAYELKSIESKELESYVERLNNSEEILKQMKDPNSKVGQDYLRQVIRAIANAKLMDRLLKDNPVKASKEKKEVQGEVKEKDEKPIVAKTSPAKKTAANSSTKPAAKKNSTTTKKKAE